MQAAPLNYDGRQPLSLAVPWQFSTGDNLAWAQPEFDDAGWETMDVPKDWRSTPYAEHYGYAWYRLTLQLPPQLLTEDAIAQLGVTIGKVYNSYQLYAGGELVGSMWGKSGNWQQYAFDKQSTHRIPARAVNANGEVVLALRIHREDMYGQGWGGGPYGGDFVFGPYHDVYMELLNSEIRLLLLASLYFFAGFYHIALFFRNRSLNDYLAFGCLSILLAGYTIAASQWKFSVNVDYYWIKFFDFIVGYLMIPVAVEAAWRTLGKKPGKWVRVLQAVLLLPAVVIILWPGYESLVRTLKPWQLVSIPAMFFTLGFILREAWRGNADAKIMLVGSLIVIVTASIDMLTIMGVVDSPYILASYGFMLYILSMIASIANRFSNYKDSLEIEVSNRTRQLEKVNSKLETLASTDMLTNLLNRHAMNDKVLAHERKQIDKPMPFVVMVMDIDHFKDINDAYGHTVGDEVLSQFGELVSDVVQPPNIASRWGGEEFVMLLPATTLADATKLAEKLRHAISTNAFHSRQRTLAMTATIGIAQGEGKQSFQSVLELADRAMYQGKRSGRNKVVTG